LRQIKFGYESWKKGDEASDDEELLEQDRKYDPAYFLAIKRWAESRAGTA